MILLSILRRLINKGEPPPDGDEGKSGARGDALGNVKIRPYRRADRAAILQIAATDFEGVSLDENVERAFGPMGERWQELKRRAVDSDLNHNPQSALVAELRGTIIGFVCNRLYRMRSIGHVANLAVARKYQGRGVGKALMAASLAHFRRRGMRYVRIETLEQNTRASAFYPALGFKEVGRQIYYFREL